MIGYKKPLGMKMLGHKKALGKAMLGSKMPLMEVLGVANMTRKLEQEKKSGGLERSKRGSGWNQGGQYSG